MLKDLRYTLRILGRSRPSSSAAIVMLALCVGMATSIFAVVDAALLRPLSYPEAERLVALSYVEADGSPATGSSPRAFLDWRERAHSFESLAAIAGGTLVLADASGEPTVVRRLRVSGDYFRMLRMNALVGRTFGREAEMPGADRVVLLTFGFWNRAYGGDPRVVGRPLVATTGTFEIIGVLPPTFERPPGRTPDVVVPLSFSAEDRQPGILQSAGLTIEGRLVAGVAGEAAALELTSLEQQLAGRRMGFNRGRRVVALPLHEKVTMGARSWMLLLLGGIGFVIVVACINLSALFAARGLDRRGEYAVRAALGAPAHRLAGQVVIEGLVISAAGAVLGGLLAWWGVEILRSVAPPGLPRASTIALDMRALAFCSLTTVLMAVLFTALPAWRVLRQPLTDAIQSARAVGRDGYRFNKVLATMEVAGAVTLLIGAGLFVSSFAKLSAVDLGFQTSGLYAMEIQLPNRPDTAAAAAEGELLDAVVGVPGVAGAALNQHARPLGGARVSMPLFLDGSSEPAGDIAVRVVSSGYLPLLGVRLLRGRGFDDGDAAGGAPVALLTAAAERKWFQGRDPLGSRVTVQKTTYLIVGTVADLRLDDAASRPEPEIFLPFAAAARGPYATLVLRASGAAEAVLPRVRQQVLAVSPGKPITDVEAVDDTLKRASSPRVFNMYILIFLAVVALAISVSGIYGLLRRIVSARSREIAVRMALGATIPRIHRMFFETAARVLVPGLLAGVLVAWTLASSVESFLYEVRGHDPLVFGVSAVLLMGTAGVAAWLAIRDVTRSNPASVMRG